MKKIITLLIASVLFVGFVFSQEKMLTIDEAVLGAYRDYLPQNLINIKWRDNENYTYIEAYRAIYQANVNSDKSPNKILSLEEINKILANENKENLPYFYEYKWLDSDKILFSDENRRVIFSFSKNEITAYLDAPKDAENSNFCKENNFLAYTIENNLYFSDKNGKQTKVTNYEDKNMVCGKSVSRNEFGISGGIFWSPKGNKLAFFRKNEDDVASYPLVDISTRIAEVKNIKYPMAGEGSENVALGVYDINSKKTVWIEDEPDSEKYLTCISWNPSGEYIFIAVLNREQNHMKLNKYDASTGKFIKTLFEEKNKKYVEPEHNLFFLKNKTEQFIWQSERDGFNHLYLYNTEGELIKQLTKGDWVVTEILGFDEKEKNLYYVSTEESPIERHLYKLNMKKLTRQKLSKQSGMHSFTMTENAEYFTDSYSSVSIPRKIDILDTDGFFKNILTAANPLSSFKMPEMELLTLKSADGKTDLHGRIVKPLGYESGKKFPVIVYVYGGPHAQLVTNSWLGGTGLWDYYMAQKGYVVFTLDNRGSANRGFDFESVIHRQCGQNEMLDQMKGVEYLKTLPFVDAEKIGVHGWSYGGFMTISLLTNYPETFKVGVAGGPVIDWKYYEVMYGERYMDTPQENPDGYKKTSLLEKAKDLKSDLLIIQGYIDNTVVPQHSLSFLRETEKAKILVDFYTYPTHEHNVRGEDRIHLMRKVTKYFDDYLK